MDERQLNEKYFLVAPGAWGEYLVNLNRTWQLAQHNLQKHLQPPLFVFFSYLTFVRVMGGQNGDQGFLRAASWASGCIAQTQESLNRLHLIRDLLVGDDELLLHALVIDLHLGNEFLSWMCYLSRRHLFVIFKVGFGLPSRGVCAPGASRGEVRFCDRVGGGGGHLTVHPAVSHTLASLTFNWKKENWLEDSVLLKILKSARLFLSVGYHLSCSTSFITKKNAKKTKNKCKRLHFVFFL